ncbi:hypothetical protein [Dryocola clanedunensis]
MNKGTDEIIKMMRAQKGLWGSVELTSEDADELIAALELKEEQRANWFQIAQMLGEEMDAAEKRIAELEANKLSVKLPEGFIWGADDTDGWLRKSDVIAVIQAAGGIVERSD